MKFVKGLVVFLLVAVIIGGVGYIGYSLLFMNHSGHNMGNTASTAAGTSQTEQSKNTTGVPSNNQQTVNEQPQQNGGQSAENVQAGSDITGVALQNRDSLDKSISIISEALKNLTVDPYAASTANPSTSGNMQGSTQTSGTDGMTMQDAGNNTVINIYPQNDSSGKSQANMNTGNTAQSAGAAYDANKMDQLHSGLYKISIGMALLNQLDKDLVEQAGNLYTNPQNPVEYYSNQYYLTVQNMDRLNQALSYINEASNLVNINPYITPNGLVYDKDRMNQIHQGLFQLSEGIASLDRLSDDLTKQAVSLSNKAQAYLNNTSSGNNGASMNMSMNHSTGLFGSISASNILSIILILFIVGLIIGIFGYVYSLVRNSKGKPVGDENTAL